MPVISVMVPIYKVEAYLDRCVRSITEQTYKNTEIILVDDGSPDNCPHLCDAWAERDSRIKVIHKDNGGLSDARNAGLEAATGEYISFIDSDDFIAPEFLSELYSAMTESGADIAECSVTYVDEEGSELRYRNTATVSHMDKLEALRRLVLEDGIYQTVWNKLYRRSVIDGIPFEKGKHHEDDFWTYQVFDRIEKLVTVPTPMYYYLQRSSSIIGSGYTFKRLDGLNARYLRMEYLQKYPCLAELTRQMLIMDCMWHLQSVKKILCGDERADGEKQVRKYAKSCPAVPLNRLSGKLTHRVWYVMFRLFPNLTTAVRNMIGIG